MNSHESQHPETTETSSPQLSGTDHDAMCHNIERQFREEHPILWTVTLLGPPLFTVTLLVFIGLISGWPYAGKLIVTAFLSVLLFGRFIILGGSDLAAVDPELAASAARALTSWELFAMVTYLDIAIATMLAFHLGFMFRIPWLGPKVQQLMLDGRFILSHQPWMRRATFAGLVAFVMFPLAATGSVGGSIFGRLVGLGRGTTLFGILLGSLIGNGLMLMASDFFNKYLPKDDPIVKYGGIAVIVLIIVLLEWRYRHLRNKYAEGQQAGGKPGEAA